MKKLLLFILLISSAVIAFGQDIIVKANGEEIKAKVFDVGATEIKYKKYENPDGPVYIIAKNQVFMIKYENGNKDVFGNSPAIPNQPPKTNVYTPAPKPPALPPEPKSPFYKNRQNYYFSMAVGGGVSYGGLGLRMQARAGGEVGFGFHWGTGYLPTFDFIGLESDKGTFMASAGFKFFAYKGIYIDAQFGIIGKEYVLDYTDNYDLFLDNINGKYFGISPSIKLTTYDDYSDDYLLFGPSFMAGVDWIFGKHIGFNAAGGISFPVNGSWAGEIFPAADLGFLLKF